ncbi:uncharacterized protein TNCV_4894801 [Trichonephila clavipes]|nr:uncharacterized protein TNCV_4894801 [Trichonephila clavipes]
MPITRAIDEPLKALLEGINALKSGQEKTKERMENMQEEIKNELKERMEKGHQEMQKLVEEKIEKKVWEEIGKIKEQVEERIEEVAENFTQRVEDLEKKLLTCGNTKNESKFVPVSSVPMSASPVPLTASLVSVKLSTYDGKPNWKYFVDNLKEREIQKAVRMADVQDLKSALLYALKVEAANETSCRDSHSIRRARVTTDAPCELHGARSLRN